jgi:hypothetical protein
MRLSVSFLLTPTSDLQVSSMLELPFVVELEAGTVVRIMIEETSFAALGPMRLEISAAIDSQTLSTRPDPLRYSIDDDGASSPLKAVVIPEAASLVQRAIDTVSAISFLTGCGISGSRMLGEDRIVAESTHDEAVLDVLGSRTPVIDVIPAPEQQSFHVPTVRAGDVRALLPRHGIRLFADALSSEVPVSRYRNLWLVLESAFGLDGRALISALAGFGPLRDLGVDEDELQQLLILRGRASHAASRAGVKELGDVEIEVLARLGRLQNIAERLILTKENWGERDFAARELLPLTGYVDRDGYPVFPAPAYSSE